MNTRKPNKEEEARKDVCLEQLALDRQRLLLRWPFIGSIIMRMELIPVRDDRLRTAATNGDCIFVDVDFYSKLGSEQRLFVLAHEVWHCVLLHFARKGARDHHWFNYAADLEIHFALAEEKMDEPWVLPHDTAWKDLAAEEIYELLMKKTQGEGGRFEKGGKSSKNMGSNDASFDKHIYQGERQDEGETGQAGETSREDTERRDGQESRRDGSEEDAQSSQQQRRQGDDAERQRGSDKSSQDEQVSSSGHEAGQEEEPTMVIDGEYDDKVRGDAVEQVRSRVVAAAQQIERMRGTLPAKAKLLIESLQKPKLRWQELLKQFVTSCYTGSRRWLPPSRRHVWHKLYLPSMHSERLRAVVALDTSGSTQLYMGVFFAELVGLIKTFGNYDLTVIQCDAEVQKVEHFSDTVPMPDNMKWVCEGCGGTSFTPVFDYVEKHPELHPDVLLYFTDGGGDAPERAPDYPVMWVLTHDGDKPCEWGCVAHFKYDAMEEVPRR